MENEPTGEKPISRRICAWCKKDMGEVPGAKVTSHSACPECIKKYENELEQLEKQAENEK